MTTIAATPPLDIESLLAPIPGPAPGGEPKAYLRGLRDQFLELRREEYAEEFDDATRPAELKRADWDGVVSLAIASLTNTTKDLRIVCHLLEGLTHTADFAVLRDGMTLLRRLITECWGRVIPPIDEDDDLEERITPLINMLDDPTHGVCFPERIHEIPILSNAERSFNARTWTALRGSREAADQKTIAETLARTTEDDLRATSECIGGCSEELRQIAQALEERAGDQAPAFTHALAALSECKQLVDNELRLMSPRSTPNSEDSDGASDNAPRNTPSMEGPIKSRAEAYAHLSEAASFLRQVEPHSPIPYLVQKAVALGQLPFPRLMEELIRDGGVLSELGREVGVAFEDANSSS